VGKINRTAGIDCRTSTTGPEAPFLPVWRGDENTALSKRVLVISHHVTMEGLVVAVRGPGNKNLPTRKQQGWSLPFPQRAESKNSSIGTSARTLSGGTDPLGSNLIQTRSYVQRVQGLIEGGFLSLSVILLRFCHHVHRVSGGVDDRSASDSNLRLKIRTTNVLGRDGADGDVPARREKVGLPNLLSTVCVECIDLVVFGGNIYQIVKCSTYVDARNIE